ncbi:hypothetical protein G7K_3253-t1 [Saitoella complicata NRRL Y-17804]|uniref:SigF-like NTF2-like domain-containing protein n=1 Tax=Saitoella complicata (strain BCRC 22490 / CBS 7301 / JCM 7358 / NBRC 10748 / NRRL Y-17804) TaxID=698492 RepID=A0A0E9NI53_SAICN|nr:hypothetical protein G7K_3253-t1 [Saitoella complicata NRRL Y-17804]
MTSNVEILATSTQKLQNPLRTSYLSITRLSNNYRMAGSMSEYAIAAHLSAARTLMPLVVSVDVNKQVPALEKYYAPDVIFTDPLVYCTSRAQMQAIIATMKFFFRSIETNVVNVYHAENDPEVMLDAIVTANFHYFIGLGLHIRMRVLAKIVFNHPDGLITLHQDMWSFRTWTVAEVCWNGFKTVFTWVTLGLLWILRVYKAEKMKEEHQNREGKDDHKAQGKVA